MVDESTEQPTKRAKHPNSLANLQAGRWKPGQTGNPLGSSLTARLQNAMDKPKAKLSDDPTVAELIIQSTLEGALLREPTPFREVWDRTEGKLTDTPILQDNRVINFIVSGDKAKELMEGVEEFGIFNREEEE